MPFFSLLRLIERKLKEMRQFFNKSFLRIQGTPWTDSNKPINNIIQYANKTSL